MSPNLRFESAGTPAQSIIGSQGLELRRILAKFGGSPFQV